MTRGTGSCTEGDAVGEMGLPTVLLSAVVGFLFFFLFFFFIRHIVVNQFSCGNGFSPPRQIAFHVVEWDDRCLL